GFDARSNVGIADAVFVREQEVQTAAACFGLFGFQSAMQTLLMLQPWPTVLVLRWYVHIEHPEAGTLAGRDADKRAGVAFPQLPNDALIKRGAAEPIADQWRFFRQYLAGFWIVVVGGSARENRPPLLAVGKGE